MSAQGSSTSLWQQDTDDPQVVVRVQVRHERQSAVLQLADSGELQLGQHAQLVQLAIGQEVQAAAQHEMLRLQPQGCTLQHTRKHKACQQAKLTIQP